MYKYLVNNKDQVLYAQKSARPLCLSIFIELRVLANKTHERYENQILLTRELLAFNDTCLHHSGLNAFELDKFIVCWSLLHIKNFDDWTQGMYAHGKLVALLWLLDGDVAGLSRDCLGVKTGHCIKAYQAPI